MVPNSIPLSNISEHWWKQFKKQPKQTWYVCLILSLCPCSKIIQRETIQMKARPLTPLVGNAVRNKSDRANTDLSSAPQRWKTDLDEITSRKRQKEFLFYFFLFIFWTLFSNIVFLYGEIHGDVTPCVN